MDLPGLLNREDLPEDARRVIRQHLAAEADGSCCACADPAAPEPAGHYHQLLEAMLDGFAVHEMIFDCEGRPCDYRFLLANPAFERLTGLPREQIIGRTVREVLPDLEDEWIRRYGDVVSSGRHAHFCEYQRAIGRYYEVEAFPCGGSRFACLFEDVTTDRQLDQERRAMLGLCRLLHSQSDLQTLLQEVLALLHEWSGCSAVGIRLRDGEDFPYYETSGFDQQFVRLESALCARDETGEIVRDGDGKATLACMCGNVLCGRFDPALPFFTLQGSFWTNSTTALLATTSEADRQSRTRNRCYRAGYESVALVPLRCGGETIGLLQMNDRRPGQFTVAFIDMIERLGSAIAAALAHRQALEATRQSEAAFRTLVENIPGVVYRCTATEPRRLTFISDGCEQMTGRPAEDFLRGDVRWEDLCVAEDAALMREGLERGVAGRGTYSSQYRLVHTDGSVRWVQSRGRCTCGADGQPLHLDGVITDITALKNAEQALRLATVGQLAAGVAHEFNNLLSSLTMRADLALHRPTEANWRKLAEVVSTQSRHGAEICQRLSAFARPQKPQRQGLPLAEPIRRALALTAPQLQAGQVIASFEDRAGDARISGDPGQLQQVFLNLFLNALHAMPNGGKLSITSRLVAAEGRPPIVRVEVTDTGTGIAASDLERIFEPFFTTKGRLGGSDVPGTGLGLAVSHSIVAAHAGTISVRSTPGHGTTFDLSFPALPAEAAADTGERPSSPLVTGCRGLRILLAEDDAVLREALQAVLEEHGCRLTVAADAPEAVARLWTDTFDVVVTDLLMPGGGGCAVIERGLAHLETPPPVIIISGQAQRSAEELRRATGAAAVLRKPFTPLELLAVIQHLTAPEGTGRG